MTETKQVEREAASSSGGRLVTVDGRVLPLRGVAVHADACGGIARVTLEQRFVNPYPDPLRVSYLVPLPPDGALAGYSFRIGERRVVGEVDRITAARARFEEALLEGKSAGLVEQDRPNLFTLEIGNIPPGAEVVAELRIDQRLQWLAEGAWEWRFPTVVAPRYLGAAGRVPDAGGVSVDVTEARVEVALAFGLTVRDALAPAGEPESPSHPIAVNPAPGGLTISLAGSEASLDRDVVVRWPAAHPTVSLAVDAGCPVEGQPHAESAYGLLTIVPPAPGGPMSPFSRDVIVLLDTSGSMEGEPLEQARRVVAGLIESLGDADRLELIEFSDEPRRWKPGAVSATRTARQEALAWLRALRARGGTEMGDGVAEALRPLRSNAQRQVVLVTDGLVGFEGEIVASVLGGLPAGSRLHTVGVGPAVNRGLTGSAARAGRGAEVLVGLEEKVEPVVERLLAQMRAPLVTDLELSGSVLLAHAPERLPDLYAGMPVRIALRLRPEGGAIRARGRTPAGAWEASVNIAPVGAAEGNAAAVTLYGRERVEDLEMWKAGDSGARVDAEIERVGLDFQIATRLTSWVAVSEEPTVDPTQPIRRERIPHALPQGLSVEGLGLRTGARSGRLAGLRLSLGVTRFGIPPLRGVAADYASVLQESRDIDYSVVEESFDAAPPLPPFLLGRLTWRRGRDLAVEIAMLAPLEWAPAAVEVAWSDGAPVRGQIVHRGSTRAGSIGAGQVIRLVVRVPEDSPAEPPERITVETGGTRLEVVIER